MSRQTAWSLAARLRAENPGRLANLDEMSVWVADVATDLVLVLFRRRQELSTPGAPFGVHGLDILDPDVEEAADPVRVARRLQVTVGLSSVGPPPVLMTIQLLASATFDRVSGKGHPATEYLGVEAPRALDIV